VRFQFSGAFLVVEWCPVARDHVRFSNAWMTRRHRQWVLLDRLLFISTAGYSIDRRVLVPKTGAIALRLMNCDA